MSQEDPTSVIGGGLNMSGIMSSKEQLNNTNEYLNKSNGKPNKHSKNYSHLDAVKFAGGVGNAT